MSYLNMRAWLVSSLALIGPAAFAQQISVTVDGQEVQFPGIGPKYMNGRVLVPVRGVFKHMGATVLWHPSSRTVTADDGERQVKLVINSRTAWVNGQQKMLDVPAKIIDGSTVVPLRFLSESLGASVEWNNVDRVVMITTVGSSGSGSLQNRSGMEAPRFVTLDAGTVIPVRLDDELSSNMSHRGDTFTATIRQDEMPTYGGIPWGTKVEGRVVTARPRRGNDPGILELRFTTLRLPNGSNYGIDGSLTSLDSNMVDRRDNGTLYIRPGKKDDRLIYAGIGAAGGLIVGILTKRPLEGSVIGGILGYLYGEKKRQDNPEANNVVLKRGTEFGVRLDRDLRVREM